MASKAEDKKKRELVDARNRAEALAYTAEKALKDAGDKVDAATKDEVTKHIEGLKKAKESNNVEDITSAEKALSQSLSKVGETMQKQNAEKNTEQKNDTQKGDIKDTDHKDVNE